MSDRLFRMIEMPSDEPVQYVGVYVLHWGDTIKPTVGFVEVCPDDDECEHGFVEHCPDGCN